MKIRWMILAGIVFGAGSLYAVSTPICPTTTNNSTGADSTGCSILISLTSATAGTVTTTATGPYDGTEDVTVGITNHSSAPITSLSLTANNGAFGFDGDGIQTYTANNGVTIGTGGATGYEGPTSAFNLAGVDGGTCSGSGVGGVDCPTGNGTLVVNFSTALGAGASTYISLEGSPSIGGGISVGPGAPEPGTLGALGAGLLGLLGMARYRRVKK